MRGLSEGLFTVPHGEIFLKVEGKNYFEDLGEMSDCKIEMSAEMKERYSTRSPGLDLLSTKSKKTTGKFTVTLRQMTGIARALSLMAEVDVMSQTAVQDATETIDMIEGGIYELSARRLLNFSIPNAVADVDYVLDAEAGLVQSLTLTGLTTVTYDAPAISAGHKSGIGNAPTLTGAITIRGTNDEGVKSLTKVWKVRFRPTGGRSFISEEEDAELQLEGDILPDLTKPLKYRYGQEEDL